MMRYDRSPARSLVGLLAAVLCLSPAVCSAETTALPKKVTTVEGITEYRLDNGLRVLLYPDPSAAKVTVNMTVLVGSRHEGYGESGMAHLLEHMVFKGTPRHSDVPKALRDHGAEFNGTTNYDRTNYFESLNGTEENLAFALDLEADRLVNSYVKREDLASEMTVVRNEFERNDDNPQNVLEERLLAAAYLWHNYGKTTIGNRSDIERVPIDRLQTFYHKYYQPDNVVLIIAGRFNPTRALELVEKTFGAIKKPTRQLESTYTEEPVQDGERNVVLRRVGSVGVVGAVYHIPAGSHEDFPALEVLATMLTSEPNGLLYKALVQTKKATNVIASAESLHDPGVLEVIASVERGNSVEAVRDLLLDLMEKLPTEKFDPTEVEQAKQKLAKNRELQMNDSNRIGVALSNWMARGDWRLFFLHRDRIAKVTPEDVARVARRYLLRSNRTTGIFIPSDKTEVTRRAKVPATPDLDALFKNYTGGKAVAAGEFFDPTPENIEKHSRRMDLPSGVKAALLPKKTRGEAVVAKLTLRYGNPDSLKGNVTAAQFLPVLMARGTKKHTRQELEVELDRLKARLQPGGNLGEVSFLIECKRETLPGVMSLLTEVLREPSFPANEFDTLKRQTREVLERNRTEPNALASRTLQQKLSPYPKDDIRYVPSIDESVERLEALTLEQVSKLYKEQLGGQTGELVVVGDFDPASVVKSVNSALEGWTTTTPYKRVERPAVAGIKGESLVIDTPDKKNACYIAAMTLPLNDSDPDNAALEVGDFLFGGGALSSRLGNRVRQKEGLSYTVQAQYNADDLDKRARFLMFAICNPENIDKVDAAIRDELDKLLRNGVSAKEMDEAKKAFLAQMQVRRSTDGQLLNLLAEGLYAGRTMAYYADLEKQIAALTPESVSEAFHKHIDPQKLVIIRAGDFKTKKN